MYLPPLRGKPCRFLSVVCLLRPVHNFKVKRKSLQLHSMVSYLAVHATSFKLLDLQLQLSKVAHGLQRGVLVKFVTGCRSLTTLCSLLSPREYKYLIIILPYRVEYHLILSRRELRPSWQKSHDIPQD